jgi:Protein of unknown function (DUF3105)
MATRKEEKARLRAERLAAERREAASARQRLILGYVVAGVLTAAVLAGVVVVALSGGGGAGGADQPAAAHIDTATGSVNGVAPDAREGTPPPELANLNLTSAARDAGCELRLNLPDEGNAHVKPGTHVTYHTNPPTSGNHVATPFQEADGAYSEEPDAIDFVHSLEHGRIEIQYAPNLPEEDQLALKGVFDESPSGMLLFPNRQMPYEVATTAWTQLMGCKKYEGAKTLDAIRDFRDSYRGHGPETQVPINP